MKTGRSVGGSWLLIAASLLGARSARAAEASPAHLSYEVPAGCPSEAEFLDMVSRDGGQILEAPDGEPARVFAVTVETKGAIAGRLVVRELDGSETSRSLGGERCEDVVRSLAVLVALTAPAPPAPARPVVVEPPVASAARPAQDVAATTHGLRKAHELVEEEPAEPYLWTPRWRFDSSVEGTLEGGSPGLVPGLAAYVEVLHEVPELFAPSFRLGVEVTAVGTDDGYATYQKRVVHLDACPFRLIASPPWARDALSVQLCARVDAGVLTVQAFDLNDAVDVRRPWVAPGALLRLRWLFPHVFLEAEGGAVFPLARERFVVGPAPATQTFEVPAVAATGGLGVGVVFL